MFKNGAAEMPEDGEVVVVCGDYGGRVLRVVRATPVSLHSVSDQCFASALPSREGKYCAQVSADPLITVVRCWPSRAKAC